MYREGYVEDENGTRHPIASASTLNNLRSLRSFVCTEQPSRSLEIGLAFGASALTLLASMKEFCAVGFHHTAIDPFQSNVWSSIGTRNVLSAGFGSEFRHIETESCSALARLYDEGERFDLIYVDGSHIFEDVFVDFFFSTRILNPNGLLLFDDSTDAHVKKVIRFIDRNYSSILDREPDAKLFKQSLKRRLAQAIGMRQLTVYRKTGEPPRPWDTKLTRF